MDLKSKVVVITGASSGIGAALAIKLVQEGAKVVIIGRNETKLAKVAKECTKNNEKPLAIIADVTKENDAARIINDTIKTYKRIDVLVNNAGYGQQCEIKDQNALKVYDGIMNTNMRAVVNLTHLAVPHLEKTKGNIINISSVASTTAMPSMSAYCTSKAALDHFSRCMAAELGPKGIRVNVINPGPVDTDFHINMGLNDAEIKSRDDKVKRATVLCRRSMPDEIADLCMFVMCDKSKGVTGACFLSDNGFGLKGMAALD